MILHPKLFAVAAIFFICALGAGAVRTSLTKSESLVLSVSSSKPSYQLGEPVELTFTLTNKGSQPIDVGCFWISTGDIRVFIAMEQDQFLEYDAGWGGVDASCANILKPDDRLEIPKVKILWNRTIKDSDKLSQDVLKRARQGKIIHDYAFSASGAYLIKALFSDLESKSVQVEITEPIGNDLEVWNTIKDRADIAYFMQNGFFSIPSHKTEERAKLLAEIEGIVAEHPNSIYAGPIRESLEKYKVSEEKRKAFQEQIRQRQKP